MRSETPAPDPIVALWKDTGAERFEIQALSRGEAAALVDAALGGQVDGSTVQALWRLAQGNPLYLRELILGGLDSGNLACVARCVALARGYRHQPAAHRADRSSPWPPGHRGAGVAGTPRPGRASRRAVARIAGRPTGSGRCRPQGPAADRWAAQQIRVRLAHPLYAEVIGARVSPLRARAVFRELAAAVEAAGGRGLDDRLRVATWRLEAGSVARHRGS